MYHIFFLHFCLILKEKIIEHKQIDNLYQISNYFIYICLLFIIDIFKIVNINLYILCHFCCCLIEKLFINRQQISFIFMFNHISKKREYFLINKKKLQFIVCVSVFRGRSFYFFVIFLILFNFFCIFFTYKVNIV